MNIVDFHEIGDYGSHFPLHVYVFMQCMLVLYACVCKYNFVLCIFCPYIYLLFKYTFLAIPSGPAKLPNPELLDYMINEPT